MLRTALLSLILFVSLSTSTSPLRKSISRRQSEPQHCQAIEGFDCKCSSYRVTCTTDRSLPSEVSIVQNEKHKYQSVELVVQAEANIEVSDQTFAPVKELYKPDGDNLEFRIKFEKFTALHLSSPGIFNKVFPDNLPSNARKHLALEIYNPQVQPNDNVNLFQNLNADSLELYALYPFHGTFQQLFNGANIKYLRLSGGDIRSDLSTPFTGNIGRLELAKQANALSVQNFPVYPAHELIINAFYITEFNTADPPNYGNLAELRVHSPESIPAHAFRQFPDVRVLSISTDKEIDPHALDGLNHLEKLTIKDTKASLDLLKSVPTVKEYETNVDKLDEKTQCQLIEKLANGQIAVQAIPNGRDCTCVSAYLDTASGRYPCEAQNCDQSSCAAIKNNYDASTRTFSPPPAIRRSDGTDALRQREPRVYTAPFQVPHQDHEKLQKGTPTEPPPQEYDPQRPGDEQGQPDTDHSEPKLPDENDSVDDEKSDQSEYPPGTDDSQNEKSYSDYMNDYYSLHDTLTTPIISSNSNSERDNFNSHSSSHGTHDGHAHHGSGSEGGENRPDGEGGDQSNRQEGEGGHGTISDVEGAAGNGTETATPSKRGMSWLPIIIIAASIVGLLLIGLIVLLIRKKKTSNKGGYGPTATNEQGAAATTASRA